jgi:hypothetical protein
MNLEIEKYILGEDITYVCMISMSFSIVNLFFDKYAIVATPKL